MATAIHREHFLVTMLKKEISTAEELDLRPLGKVIIFRVKQNLPIIYRLVLTMTMKHLKTMIGQETLWGGVGDDDDDADDASMP